MHVKICLYLYTHSRLKSALLAQVKLHLYSSAWYKKIIFNSQATQLQAVNLQLQRGKIFMKLQVNIKYLYF